MTAELKRIHVKLFQSKDELGKLKFFKMISWSVTNKEGAYGSKKYWIFSISNIFGMLVQ